MTVTLTVAEGARAALDVLDAFELRVARRRVTLPRAAQRVLAFLAVCGPRQRRDRLAGVLWAESTQERALANLRTALWQVRRVDERIVACRPDVVALQPGVVVDLAGAVAAAQRLVHASASEPAALVVPVSRLEADVLPDWDDDWLVLSRERHHQLRIHALEALSEQLAQRGRFAEAVDAAYAAITAEPLRESAQAALLRALLAEGNRTAAARHLERYRRLLAEETGMTTSRQLDTLLRASALEDGAETARGGWHESPAIHAVSSDWRRSR